MRAFSLTATKEWKNLVSHSKKTANLHMKDLFAADSERFMKYHIDYRGLLFDYSKNVMTQETLDLLFALARKCEVESFRDKMFAGEKINNSENRSVLHTALRKPPEDHLEVEGEDITGYVHECLERIKAFSEKVRKGKHKGCKGGKITDVVNIGIGGSDLGPLMVCEALKPFSDRSINMHFVSNVDGTHIKEVLRKLNPYTTLFIISSKTFTTQETMRNAKTAKTWFLENGGNEKNLHKHFVAVSTNTEATKEFGIASENVFGFRDWVGGRYSLWSSIGLSVCISIGFDNFGYLLEGANAVDEHFRQAPLEHNIPVIMALLGIWYRNFKSCQSYAVLPYDQYLSRFPAYLQQMDMESNGKNIDRDGKAVDYDTGAVIFGEPGTNGQHAFYQLLHQGTTVVPCDFIAPIKSMNPIDDHHKLLLSNVLAQSQAFMQGRTIDEAGGDIKRSFAGNRPSNMILLDLLDPFHLGMLIALYEHKIFVQGIIWNLNSFDQWGVELGKVLAKDILSQWDSTTLSGLDSSTEGLLNRCRNS